MGISLYLAGEAGCQHAPSTKLCFHRDSQIREKRNASERGQIAFSSPLKSIGMNKGVRLKELIL